MFIRECLQSILDQETDFPFEVIVGDDCSTDGTGEIVREFVQKYPDRVRALFHSRNVGATANYLAVHAQARGDYVAHVDGDDYALPGKLAALASALDANPHANLAWHRLKILNVATGEFKNDLIEVGLQPPGGFSRDDLLACGSVGGHSASIYRACRAREIDLSHAEMLDFYIAVERIGEGKGIWVDGFYGVYRRDIGVMVAGGQKQKVLLKKHLMHFLQKYPQSRRHVNSLAFLLLLADLKNIRMPVTLGLWLKSLHFLAPFEFLKRLPLYRILRLPNH
jgi:glycosyltransferase involved in cell wall biosynthesis